jgi:Na+/H+-dicarboxylate symporter
MTDSLSHPTHKYSLTARIFIGMIAGVLIGFLFKLIMGESGDLQFSALGIAFSIKAIFIDGIFTGLGQIFIASLKMLVVPLVFVSLVCGTSSLSEPSKLGRLGGKSVGLYVMTTAIAVATAICMALLIAPGEGLNLTTEAQFTSKEAPNIVQVFVNMFPANPIASMAEGNMLQIIVFAVLFGIAVSMAGDTGKRVSAAFNDINTVIMNIVTMVMNLAPYGVFVLMAKLFATIGLDTILGLAKYFFLVFGVLVMHAVITYPIIFKSLSGLNPIILLRKMRNTALFAFSTSSSNATLPITMDTAKNRLGVKSSVSSFTIPLGATINMDGTAIMQGVATVFIAQVYGVDLSVTDFLMVILTATLASIGTAGVPGVGLIMLAMVLQQVN